MNRNNTGEREEKRRLVMMIMGKVNYCGLLAEGASIRSLLLSSVHDSHLWLTCGVEYLFLSEKERELVEESDRPTRVVGYLQWTYYNDVRFKEYYYGLMMMYATQIIYLYNRITELMMSNSKCFTKGVGGRWLSGDIIVWMTGSGCGRMERHLD